MDGALADNIVTLNVSQQMLFWLVAGALGLLGYRRGVNREALSLLGVGLGVFLSRPLASLAGPLAEDLYRLAQKTLSGGGEGLNGALQANALPGVSGGIGQGESLALTIFVLLTLGAYVYGEWRVPAPRFILGKVLGMGVGAIKGLLLAYCLLPLLFPRSATMSAMAVGSTASSNSNTEVLAWTGVLLVVVLIVSGLYNATRPDQAEPFNPGSVRR